MINIFKERKLYIYLFCYLAILLLHSCNSSRKIFKNANPYDNFRGFVPTDPTEYADKVAIVKEGELIYREIKLLSTEQMLSFLNNETVLVSIGKFTAEGGISYLPVTFSNKGSSYKITMDYMKSATLPVLDSSLNNIIGLKRVGVGLRLISLITTLESGINIGDLSSIGLAAKANKLTGTLMIEVIGIKSEDVTTLIPLPSEINSTTIQNAMQALATIKSKIYNPKTTLYPQVMAINDYYNSKVSVRNIEAIENVENKNKINLQFGKTLDFGKPITPNTRIYLLAGNRNLEHLFPDYTKELVDLGYMVLGAKFVVDRERPNTQEVRYFFESDAKQAEKLAEILSDKLSTPNILSKKYDDARVNPGYIEIWFGR